MKRSADEISTNNDTNGADNGSASIHVSQGDAKRRKCPYLDTINHQMLDFDFEKVCSVSLSDQNVYACLVCGKYFKGRGRATHAFTHSVQSAHHVFINLQNDKIYCLPDNYEVIDHCLKPIKLALRPTFEPAQIAKLDQNRTLAQDAFGVSYLPGFIGLNNLKNTDYISVVVQALAHVPPLRDFFLRSAAPEVTTSKSLVVHRFSELLRKMWSPDNFKNTISPHEFVQQVSVSSKKRFHVGQQNEAVEFLSWLLNELHRGLGGTSKPGSSIIHTCFQGAVHVTTVDASKSISDAKRTTAGTSPFLLMALDLPPTPLFKDSQGGNIIPQVPLVTVLEKYDGTRVTHVLQGSQRLTKTYALEALPPFVIFHVKRFTRNNFFIEKNPTIVNFPVKNLEMRDFLTLQSDANVTAEELTAMSIAELRALLAKHKVSTQDCVEKSDLVTKALRVTSCRSTKYNLIANIVHDSPVTTGKEAALKSNPLTEGSYRVHVQNRATEQWYEIQDLHVQETMPQLIGVSESYMLIYERKA